MRELSNSIKKLVVWPLAGFVVVCLLLTYWQVVAAPQLNKAEQNNRSERMRRRVQPGRLLTSDAVKYCTLRAATRMCGRTYCTGARWETTSI